MALAIPSSGDRALIHYSQSPETFARRVTLCDRFKNAASTALNWIGSGLTFLHSQRDRYRVQKFIVVSLLALGGSYDTLKQLFESRTEVSIPKHILPCMELGDWELLREEDIPEFKKSLQNRDCNITKRFTSKLTEDLREVARKMGASNPNEFTVNAPYVIFYEYRFL